jgi:HK97 gp10 family phage protein
MGLEINVHVDMSGIELIEGNIDDAMAFVIDGGTRQTQTHARRRAPVDTGHLKSSIRRKAAGSSGTVEAMAEYSIYVELGTYKMGAQPYLVPGLEAVQWNGLVKDALGIMGL